MRAAVPLIGGLLALAAAGSAGADPIVLRFGTVAPDGTGWARIARQSGSALSAATKGQVTIKWYFGGIAGDELQMAARIKRDQLDGIVSGGMLCDKLAPSRRVMKIVGLFQTRDESTFIAGRLAPTFDEELRKAGFVNLGEVAMGPDIILSRAPIRSMADLRKARLWFWDLDDLFRVSLPLMGMTTVPLPIQDAYRAYDDGRIDGFITTPTAALGFQWSAEARYVTDLRVAFLRSCMLVSTRAFDALPLAARDALVATSAKGMMQLEELGRHQDEQLMGGLFARQGLKRVPVSETFRAEFLAQALAVRDQLAANKVVPRALITRVLGLLADYRAEHHAGGEKHP